MRFPCKLAISLSAVYCWLAGQLLLSDRMTGIDYMVDYSRPMLYSHFRYIMRL